MRNSESERSQKEQEAKIGTKQNQDTARPGDFHFNVVQQGVDPVALSSTKVLFYSKEIRMRFQSYHVLR